jgi:hypothetical protein
MQNTMLEHFFIVEQMELCKIIKQSISEHIQHTKKEFMAHFEFKRCLFPFRKCEV